MRHLLFSVDFIHLLKLLPRLVFMLLSVAFALSACQNNTKNNSVDASFAPPNVQAMRINLDGQPRILSVQLAHGVTAAYSTEQANLFKLWRGTTDYSGAVFDTKHGPEPTASGEDYVREGRAVWHSSLGPVVYRGHQLSGAQTQLLYGIKGHPEVSINEVPDAQFVKGQLVFSRTFRVAGLPEASSVSLAGLAVAANHEISGNGTYSVQQQSVQLANGRTQLTLYYPALAAPIKQDKPEPEHAGLILINNSDCAACHNATHKTVGPAYQTIAERYQFISGAKQILSQKIIDGGAGNWGTNAMTAHPGLNQAQAETMVDYIFSLLSESDNALDSSDILLGLPARQLHWQAKTIQHKQSVAGAYIYQHRFSGDQPNIDILRKTAPLQAATVSQVHIPDAKSLGNITKRVALQVKTHLKITQPFNTRLRLVADDGAYLYLNGKRIIDNWGFHGPEAKDVELDLPAGLYPLEIIAFQGTGGAALSLQWFNPENQTYELLPASMMQAEAADVREVVEVVTDPDIVKTVPGDQREVAGVHPSFDLHQARPDAFKPMVGGLDFLSDGRMVVSTWDPEGSVYIVENYAAVPSEIKVKRIAQGLAEPLGLKVVDDEIYVLQKQELTKLVDVDGDGLIDRYENIANAWSATSNFHEFAFGLAYQDGYFYAALATAILPGGASADPQAPDRGKVMKISKATGKVAFIAHGLRTPNGVGRGVDNQLFIVDNQGDWLPACKIVELSEGAWYGSRSVDFDGTAKLAETLPVVWLPQDEIGNSASQTVPLNIGPYQNQMLHGDVTHGGVKRVFAERINGRLQGAVFRFSQGLEAGINRMQWAPDGSLIVGGVGNPGNWAHGKKYWYGLQRLQFNQHSTFEMLSIHAHSDGFEIRLTEPVKQGRIVDASHFDIEQWYYQPTADYGGPKKDKQRLPIKALTLSEDRTRIQIRLDGLKPKHVVYFRIKRAFESELDHELWSTEAWYTLNAIPENKPLTLTAQDQWQHNQLSAAERALGWQLLFDGKSLAGIRNYNQQSLGKRWVVDDNAIHLTGRRPGEQGWQTTDGGDIVITPKPLLNYELNLEWKIQYAGNSGIIYNVKEGEHLPFSFMTGPEFQVLDNAHHGDGRIETHRAGDNYDLIKSRFVTVLPAGEWNQVRLVVKDGHVQHWLNGYKLVDIQMHSPEWQALIAASKFKDSEHFAKSQGGHIVLQDHGDKVWYRNIKIREL